MKKWIFFADDNLAKVKLNGKYGYISYSGKALIPIEFSDCERSSAQTNYKETRYIVSKKGKYGIMGIKTIMESQPSLIVPCLYSKIEFDPAKRIFKCYQSNAAFYIDNDGKKLTSNEVKDIKDEMILRPPDTDNFPVVIRVGNKYGAIWKTQGNYEGSFQEKSILPTIYDEIIVDTTDGYRNTLTDIFGVRIGRKWGIIDYNQNILLPLVYDSINFDLSKYGNQWSMYKRAFAVKTDDKWGILGRQYDTTGLITLVPFEYNSMTRMHKKYASVQKENEFRVYSIEKFAFINEHSYSSISSYENTSFHDLLLFQVTNKLGQKVFVGNNGVEFFVD